jgi:2',3'-cyclic-nucleotide 2'-phosphodiesterase (5'-nucleotidase family)
MHCVRSPWITLPGEIMKYVPLLCLKLLYFCSLGTACGGRVSTLTPKSNSPPLLLHFYQADIEHKIVCKYVRQFARAGGKWINSNMLDHEAMEFQREYDVIEIDSPDGRQKRKVGLCAVLSNDPALYSHFEAPGAFGGATITDPWQALTKYNHILKNEHGCDVVLPLQHLYVPDDHKTCREFDFPVILSGHDHHRYVEKTGRCCAVRSCHVLTYDSFFFVSYSVDEVVEGTRLLKAGMNAEYATVLEYSWPDESAEKPILRSRFVRCQDWEADPVLKEQCESAYDCLMPLRNTELARVPPNFEPLTSNGSRDSVCTMGKYICSLLKSALNVAKNLRKGQIDAVLLMGGNIRVSFFSRWSHHHHFVLVVVFSNVHAMCFISTGKCRLSARIVLLA